MTTTTVKSGFGSLLFVVTGLGALVEGHLWGLPVVPVGLWFGLEAYLCFRAGNIWRHRTSCNIR